MSVGKGINAVEHRVLCAQTKFVFFKAYQLNVSIHQPEANLGVQRQTDGVRAVCGYRVKCFKTRDQHEEPVSLSRITDQTPRGAVITGSQPLSPPLLSLFSFCKEHACEI